MLSFFKRNKRKRRGRRGSRGGGGDETAGEVMGNNYSKPEEDPTGDDEESVSNETERTTEGSQGPSKIQLSRTRFLNSLLESQDAAPVPVSPNDVSKDRECFKALPGVVIECDLEVSNDEPVGRQGECNKISEDENYETKVLENIGNNPYTKIEFNNKQHPEITVPTTEEINKNFPDGRGNYDISDARDTHLTLNPKNSQSADEHIRPHVPDIEILINSDQDVDSSFDAFREISEGPEQIGSDAVLATVKDAFEVGGSSVDDGATPVEFCALYGNREDEAMLSISSRPLETFLDVSGGSVNSSSSESDESVPAKVKKRVHWADADGHMLESYNSPAPSSSSSEDEYEEEEVEEIPPQVKEPDEIEDEDESSDEGEDEDEISSDSIETEVEITEIVKHEEIAELMGEIECSSIQEVVVAPVDDIEIDNIEVCEEKEKESSQDEETSSDDESEKEQSETDNKETDHDENEKGRETSTPDRNAEYERMSQRIEQLQLDLLSKAADLARAQNDLDTAQLEIEAMRRKVSRLEDEIDSLKLENKALSEKLGQNESVTHEKNVLQSVIDNLEKELSQSKIEKEIMETSCRSLERERDREVARLQQALNTALKEQSEREARFQKEFETERTTRAEREAQMLDDFEWKLREVEKAGKKRVADAEAAALTRMADLEFKLVRAESELERIGELKLCEIELKQLKTTHGETRRNLRSVTRQLEELQVNEKILQEEVNRLRAALDKEKSTITALQTLHHEEIAEKDRKLNFKLESQRNQINNEWEEKLKRDTLKIKQELERNYKAEKVSAVDTAKRLKDQEIASLRQAWERKSQDFKREISEYRERLVERENRFREELENAQTNSDRDSFEMRRKIDKLDLSYQERIERLQEQHEEQISSLKAEYEKRIAQCEASYQQQAGTTRTTIELVKQQMSNENQSKIEKLQNLHQQALNEQRQLYEKQKAAEIRAIEDEHRRSLELLKKELDEIRKVCTNSPSPSEQSAQPSTMFNSFVRYLHQAVSPSVKPKQSAIVSPQPPVTGGNERRTLADHLNEEASNPYSSSEAGGQNSLKGKDYEKLLLAKVHQLTKQSNEDKAELQRLQQLLAEKEAAASGTSQQRTPSGQSPSRPGRRSRKRR